MMKVDPTQDLAFLTDNNQITYVDKISNSQETTRPLKDQFIYSSDALVNILEQML